MEDDEGFKTAEQLKAWKGMVQVSVRRRDIVLRNADFVKWAHAEGMTVTPYTFRSSDVVEVGLPDGGRGDGAFPLPARRRCVVHRQSRTGFRGNNDDKEQMTKLCHSSFVLVISPDRQRPGHVLATGIGREVAIEREGARLIGAELERDRCAARHALHDPIGIDRKTGGTILAAQRDLDEIILRDIELVGCEDVILRDDGELATILGWLLRGGAV